MNLGKVGLTVSGGGVIPGNFLAGAAPEVTKELLKLNITPHYLIGVSVGAVIVSQIAEAVTKGENLDKVADTWIRRVTKPEDIWVYPKFFKKALELFTLLEKEKVSLLKLLKLLLENKEIISDLKKFLHSPSLFDNYPFIKMLDEELDIDAVMKSDIKVEVAAVDNEGKFKIFSNKLSTSEDFKKAIVASTALPIQVPPVSIGDKSYVDGGTLKPVVISAAVHNLCDMIFIFLAKPSKTGITMNATDFMKMPWWQKVPWVQKIRAKDSIETTIERFEITNENIRKYELLKSALFELLGLQNPSKELEKGKAEEIFRNASFRFQKRHFVNYAIFEADTILPGNDFSFTSNDIKQGIEYGRQYAQRELKRLGIIP